MNKVYGVGVYDGTGSKTCPVYKRWCGMLERAYTDRFEAYTGVTVCDEWLIFSNFELWVSKQTPYWKELHLDKDILCVGNKVYCPEKCVFVPPHINKIFYTQNSDNGLPLGVIRSKRENQPFIGRCSGVVFGTDGASSKEILWKRFETKELAHRAWQKAKVDNIVRVLNQYKYSKYYDHRVDTVLLGVVVSLMSDLQNDIETKNLRRGE